jgi:hypothetical protein
MEITNNKVNPLALEGLVPTKASFVELEAKQTLEKVAPLEIPPTDQSEDPKLGLEYSYCTNSNMMVY